VSDHIRVPPHNDEAERSTLGAALIDNRVMDELLGTLAAESFYRESHRHIWRAMCALHGRGEAIDVLTLADQLNAEGLLQAAGGPNALARLSSEVPSAANVNFYAQIVRRKATLRAFITTAQTLADECYEDVEDFEGWTDRAGGQVLNLLQAGQARGGLVGAAAPIKAFFAEMESAYHDREAGDATPRLDTPFDSLNTLLYRRRFAPQDLVIMAARPGVGKTAWGLQVALHNARRGIGTAFFSLEMSNAQLAGRMIACEGQVDVGAMMLGTSTERGWSAVVDAASKLNTYPIWVDDRPSLTVYQIKAELRRLAQGKDRVQFVVIDYLQLIRHHDEKSRLSREAQMTWIAQELKNTAKELDVTILALAQLNRAVEQRGGKPRPSDLRESGGIEQAADLIGFLWPDGDAEERDDKSAPTMLREAVTVHCGLGKNRHGRMGDVALTYRGAQYRFEDETAER